MSAAGPTSTALLACNAVAFAAELLDSIEAAHSRLMTLADREPDAAEALQILADAMASAMPVQTEISA